jgi:hypothetical protein
MAMHTALANLLGVDVTQRPKLVVPGDRVMQTIAMANSTWMMAMHIVQIILQGADAIRASIHAVRHKDVSSTVVLALWMIMIVNGRLVKANSGAVTAYHLPIRLGIAHLSQLAALAAVPALLNRIAIGDCVVLAGTLDVAATLAILLALVAPRSLGTYHVI